MGNIMTNRLDRGFERYREEFEAAALRVLRSGWYILGRELEAFEKSYADYIGTKYCAGCGNGLDALSLACRAIGISEGDEVIVQGNTFIASAMGISAAGGRPVFVEPDEYYQLDPAQIEPHITERTKAVMVVHLYGQTARMDEIKAICDRHGLKIIEDCAQSHGAYAGAQKSGSIGDIGCFSFYPSKNLGCFGDGGAVVTDNEEYYERIKQLRNYGSRVRYYNEELGVNSRLDEMQAALLSVRLSHLEELNAERKAAAAFYDEEIRNPKVKTPVCRDGAEHVYHQYVIRCKERDALAEHLKSRGVDTIIHYPVPPHLSKAYAFLGMKEGSLPVTEEYADTVLSIPMYSGITREEQQTVTEAINEF
ncbi:MAG: DegT/DnrJ/EryC1/StrS family aminotransferase [Lachnospiraceae bacterium]|nr:DegT/DnrJ/EryC1/StrS family aminotransferase [Lachnospiraceae bacterium]